MLNKRDLLRKAQYFVEDNLSEIWDKPGYDSFRKRSEVTRLTNLIDNVINKEEYSKKGERVDTEALTKDIEKVIKSEEGLDIKIDKETKDSFRQFLTRRNFGEPVQYLNVSLEEGTNNLLRTEIRGEDGLTLQGNRKSSIEPKKRIQEVLEEINPGTNEISHIVLDNVTAKGSKGYAEDFTLSDLRGKLLRENKKTGKADYEKIVSKVHKKMAEEGYYPFGGRGDNDIIIYVKKHPHMKSAKLKSYIDSFMNSYFAKNKKAKKYFEEALKRNKWVSKQEAKEQYFSNIFWDMSLNGFKPKTFSEYSNVLNKLFTGKGYIKNATAWNKRNQIWFTPTWKADKKFITDSYNEYINKLKSADKKEYI